MIEAKSTRDIQLEVLNNKIYKADKQIAKSDKRINKIERNYPGPIKKMEVKLMKKSIDTKKIYIELLRSQIADTNMMPSAALEKFYIKDMALGRLYKHYRAKYNKRATKYDASNTKRNESVELMRVLSTRRAKIGPLFNMLLCKGVNAFNKARYNSLERHQYKILRSRQTFINRKIKKQARIQYKIDYLDSLREDYLRILDASNSRRKIIKCRKKISKTTEKIDKATDKYEVIKKKRSKRVGVRNSRTGNVDQVRVLCI